MALFIASFVGGVIYILHQLRFLYYRKFGGITTGKVKKIVKYTHSAEIDNDKQVIEGLSSSVVEGMDSETADNENKMILYKSYIEYNIAGKIYTRQLDGRANLDDTFFVHYLSSKPQNAIVTKADKKVNIGLLTGLLIICVVGLCGITAMFIYDLLMLELSLILLIVGVFFIISGILRTRKLYFLKYGKTTTGRVTKSEVKINRTTSEEEGKIHTSHSYSYIMSVVYAVAGKEYTGTCFGVGNIGDIFPVYYLSAKPQKYKIYTNDYDIEMPFGNLLAGVVCIVLGVIGIFQYFFANTF